MKRPTFSRPKIRLRRPRVRIRWKKKSSWWVISVAFVAFALFFAVQLWTLRYAQQLLSETLSRQVSLLSQGKYAASFDEISINYTSRELEIENLNLRPGEALKGSPAQYELNIPKISLNGLSLRQLYFNNALIIDDFIINKPTIKITLKLDKVRQEPRTTADRKESLLPSRLSQVRLNNILLRNGNLQLSTSRNNKESVLLASNVNLELGSFSLTDSTFTRLDLSAAYLEVGSTTGFLHDSIYQFKAKSLFISAQDSSFLVEGLQIKPVKSISEVKKLPNPPKNLYDIQLPQAYGYGLPLRKLVAGDSLLLEEVQLINPSFHLINLRQLTPEQRESFRLEELHSLIADNLKTAQVGQVTIKQGSLKVSQALDQQEKPKLDTRIKRVNLFQVVIDSSAASNPQKLFYSDSIRLELGPTNIQLSDGLHQLHANSMQVNSNRNHLSLTKVRLAPLTEAADSVTQYYNARIDSLDLQGIDFLEAYHQNNLRIDSLSIRKPHFYLTQLQSTDTLSNKRANKGLYQLFSNYLYELSIQNLSIQEGIADVMIVTGENPSLVSTKIKALSLTNFLLDSSRTETFRPFYAEDFRLVVADYEQNLSDNIHRIGIDEIIISTYDDLLYLKSLVISPRKFSFPYHNKPLEKVGTLIDLSIPELKFQDFDLLNAYLDKNLKAGKIDIERPELRLGFLRENTADTSQIKLQAIYEAISPYMKSLQIDQLNLNNGNLQLAHWSGNRPTILLSPDADITIDNFRINREAVSNPKRLFFADNLRLGLTDLQMHLRDDMHVAVTNYLSLETASGKIVAEAFRIRPKKERFSDEELAARNVRDYLNMQIPSIRIQVENLDKAYYQDQLIIDSIYAEQPFVELTHLPYKKDTTQTNKQPDIDLKGSELYASLSPYFSEVMIRHALLFNGTFHSLRQQKNQAIQNLTLEGISLSVNRFHLSPERVASAREFLYTEELLLRIRNYRFLFGDSLHVLQAKNLRLSTKENSIEANNILLHAPISNMREAQLRLSRQRNLFYVKVPTLRIDNINFDEIYQEEELNIGILELNTPEIRISHYTAPKKRDEKVKKEKPSPYQLIQGTLNRLSVDKALIFNAHGTYRDFSTQPKLEVKVQDFDAEIADFVLDQNTQPQDSELLYAKDVRLKVRDFVRPLSDSLHQIRVDYLEASTRSESIFAHGLSLEPLPQLNQYAVLRDKGIDRLIKLQIPRIYFHELDFAHLQQDSLLVAHVALKAPQLQVLRFPQHEEGGKVQAEQKQLNAARKTKGKIKGLLAIDSVSFLEGGFELLSISENDTVTYGLGKLQGFARNINFDSTTFSNDPRQLLTEEIQLQAQDYQRIFDDSLYRLHISRFGVSSADNRVWADKLRIYPIVHRDTFALRKAIATDQFTLGIDHVELKELDLISLLGRPTFKANQLLIDGFKLNVYRDKRYPLDKSRRPPIPQLKFRELTLPFQLDSVIVRNGYIRYAEMAKKGKEEGYVLLDDFRVHAGPLANDSLSKEKPFFMDVSFLFMGNSHLNARFEIPLNDPTARHRFYGTVDSMNLQDFNPILENTAFIRLKSGQARTISFDVTADKEEANGEMTILYDDLKVALLNKKTGTPKGLIKGIGTAVANMFVRSSSSKKTENPEELKKEFDYKRDEKRSIINYWVKSLLEGFKTSIGI